MGTASGKQKITAALVGLYGLASLIGGTIGFMKGSKESLIAGGGCGIILILCAVGSFRVPMWSFIGAIVVSLALLGFFGPKLLKNMNDMATFLGTSAGATALGMSIGGVVVLIASGLALRGGAC